MIGNQHINWNTLFEVIDKPLFFIILLSGLFIITAPVSLHGQLSLPNIKYIEKAEGFPANRVSNIFETDQGYMIICSDRGLFQYDGIEFTPYLHHITDSLNITGKEYDFLIDGKNRTWIIVRALGVYVILPDDKGINFYKYQPGQEKNAFGSRLVKLIEDDYGDVWVCTEKSGIHKYRESNQNFEQFTYDYNVEFNRITTIDERQFINIFHNSFYKDLIWLSSKAGLVTFHLKTKKFEFHPSTVEDDKILDSWIRDVHVDDEGVCYMGTWKSGMIIYHPETKVWNKFYLDESVDNEISQLNNIKSIFHYRENELFILAPYGGLFLFNKIEQDFHLYFPTQQPTLLAQEAYKDNRGNIWLNQDHRLGIITPGRQSVQKILFDESIKQSVELDNDDLLLLGDKNIIHWRKGGDTYETIPTGIHKITQMIQKGRDNVLLLTHHELLQLNLQSNKIKPFPDPNLKARLSESSNSSDLFIDDNDIWITTKRNGIIKRNISTGDNNQSLIQDTIGGVINRWDFPRVTYQTSDGCLWFGFERGLCVTCDRGVSFQQYPINTPTSDELPFTNITSLKEDNNGRLWIGMLDNGLAYIDLKEPYPQQVNSIQLFDDHAGGYVKGIDMDLSGKYLWITTGKDLSRLNIENYKVEHFGEEYGIDPVEVKDMTLCVDGDIVMGTKGGVYIFSPEKMTLDTSFNKVYINSFKVFNEEIYNNSDLLYKDIITLSHEENFFSFEFSSPQYSSPEKIKYQYMLEGIDRDWINAGTRRYANYTKIGGGHYTFLLRCSNSLGKWSSDNINKVNLHIKPAFWTTKWFVALVMGLFSGLLYFMYKYRIGQVKKEEELKTEYTRNLAKIEMSALRAQMSPHFIFNCLNSIKRYTLQNEGRKASEYLTKFSKLIRVVLQNSKSQMVSLSNELHAIGLYIDLEKLRFKNKFESKINVDKTLDIDFIEIPPSILQPYVENAIWHGLMHKETGIGILTINVRKEGAKVCVEIVDNGIGRKKAAQIKSKNTDSHKSYGMQITHDRIQLVNQLYDVATEIEIQDLYSEDEKALGTKVVIRIDAD